MPIRVKGVRIHEVDKLTVGQLLEQLRHAGAMGRLSHSSSPIEVVYVPAHISKGGAGEWAELEVQRMATFDIEAEVVYYS